jgi:RND family efflux transporter MFP subunit
MNRRLTSPAAAAGRLPERQTVIKKLPFGLALVGRASVTTWALVLLTTLASPLGARAAELAAAPARAASGATLSSFDAVVEAVRQTAVAAQVPGAVVELAVKVGDRVQAGQLLLRIDARAADQNAAASEAQVLAARAALAVASSEFGRQQQLFQKNYISQAALERAESEFKATQAQVTAQLAQAGVARTQTGFHTVRAPYAGVIAELPVALGDMAMPGRPLLTLYDPSALRITAALPQSLASRLVAGPLPKIELPSLPGSSANPAWLTPTRVQWLPTADAATHTVQLRADLPAGLVGVAPGMFARLWVALEAPASQGAPKLSVPLQAIVRRAEMTGLYVLSADGRPLLRQVRLGPVAGDRVEILSGLMPGERVVADPQAAARVR